VGVTACVLLSAAVASAAAAGPHFTRHTVGEGVSIALPSEWRSVEPGKGYAFSALDRKHDFPVYVEIGWRDAPSTISLKEWAAVMLGGASRHGKEYQRVSAKPVRLPAGRAYRLIWRWSNKKDRIEDRVYVLLHDHELFMLMYRTSTSLAQSHAGQFETSARSLRIG
jgi:hypothetical protein